MVMLVPENHPALSAIADEVPPDEITSPRIKKVLKDMRAALHSYQAEGFVGVAIAAPQIGVPLRIFLVEDTVPEEEKDADRAARIPRLVAINPVIVKASSKKHDVGEGCLSVPEKYGAVSRSMRVTLRAYDEHGAQYERGASGLLAQIFQHEVDHLDGILFTDRAREVFEKKEMTDLREAT